MAKAKFGLCSPKGVQGKEEALSHSLSLGDVGEQGRRTLQEGKALPKFRCGHTKMW